MTTIPLRVAVSLGDRSYDIVVGAGVFEAEASYEGLPAASACAIVTNETVGPLYAERLARVLSRRYREVHTITLPDGEAHKNWSTLQRIFDGLLAAGCDRKTTLFALGGGVIGDMTGFAAACYMRGVPCVQVPTTLLAQVDSSVGGKTAVNHPMGKNMIGVFYQPLRVVADVDLLATLPPREQVAGLAEVIKSAAIADAGFFGWLESNLGALESGDKSALIHAVKRSCEIKAAVVAADEREVGRRAVLNFGHTFAHAIEVGTGYGTWLHGEAVGCGMVMASDLSVRSGLCDRSTAQRIASLVADAGLPVRAPALGASRYLELMRLDKKAEDREMRFVLIEELGRAVVRTVAPALVEQTIAEYAS